MKVAILGFGKQGQSAYEYWSAQSADITICDSQIVAVPQGVKVNFESDYLFNLDQYDVIVRSPIIHPRDIQASNPDHPEVMDKVTTPTNEFMRVCPSKNIIGITGTKGKGTTSTLIAKLLTAAGHRVHLGGNIGISPLEMLKADIKKNDWVVLELANFQLIDLKYSPPIAVCLMIAPEHLDWHIDMYEYVHAKQQMFAHQKPTDFAVYNARNLYSEEVADVTPAQRLPYEVPPADEEAQNTSGVYVKGNHIYMKGQKVCNTSDVALLGRHNLENVCAAIGATWQIIAPTTEKPDELMKAVIKVFAGLPHRLEIIKQIHGVWYVNDSFGTTPETAIVAIAAFKQPKVVILGGSEKGVQYDQLAETIVKSNIRHLVIIGDTAPQIIHSLKRYDLQNKVAYTQLALETTMPKIVETAASKAEKGDVVLLSTACASFDMFKNYEDRGNQFKAAVLKLAEAAK